MEGWEFIILWRPEDVILASIHAAKMLSICVYNTKYGSFLLMEFFVRWYFVMVLGIREFWVEHSTTELRPQSWFLMQLVDS